MTEVSGGVKGGDIHEEVHNHGLQASTHIPYRYVIINNTYGDIIRDKYKYYNPEHYYIDGLEIKTEKIKPNHLVVDSKKYKPYNVEITKLYQQSQRMKHLNSHNSPNHTLFRSEFVENKSTKDSTINSLKKYRKRLIKRRMDIPEGLHQAAASTVVKRIHPNHRMSPVFIPNSFLSTSNSSKATSVDVRPNRMTTSSYESYKKPINSKRKKRHRDNISNWVPIELKL